MKHKKQRTVQKCTAQSNEIYVRGGDIMADTLFVRAGDIAKEMGVSEAMGYKIIRNLNNELKEQGFVTVQGRLSRQYFEERIYGIKSKEEVE